VNIGWCFAGITAGKESDHAAKKGREKKRGSGWRGRTNGNDNGSEEERK